MTTSLDSYLSSRKKLIDRTLLKLLRTSGAYKRFPTLDKSLHHTLLLKGKRLRPILTLMAYELFNDNPKEALEAASAIELIHVGSLMLDDLPAMDNAQFRRGKKTNHVLYGDATTILASAALWVESFHILSGYSSGQQLVDITTRQIGKDGLVLGQYMDLFAFDKKQSLKELRQCYELKTGSLFILAAAYGAILGGADTKQRKCIEAFGKSFGIAYQIRDDIVDATESQKTSGKDEQKDAKNHKPNYVSMLGIEGARKAMNDEISTARKQLAKLSLDTSRFEQLLDAISL